MVRFGRWVKGDFWLLSSDEMKLAFERAGRGVDKPHSVEVKKNKDGKVVAWRIYYRPLEPGENWD